jgi:nucleotide-binding universal stress UspA family protein
MLRHILVPTDGSPLSERALTLAETIARAQEAEVTLVRVVESPFWIEFGPDATMDAQVYDQLVGSLEQDAQQGLSRLQQQLQKSGLTTQTAMLHGHLGAALLDYEAAHQPDLVVMATHGRTGLARFALGSISDHMVREGHAPVLLVRAFSPALSAASTALVPLDGSSLAEQALPIVEALAQKPLRKVRLLQAISSPDQRDAAMTYLQSIADRLHARGLETELDVRTEDPADAIRQVAAHVHLVILSTHGRGGLDRFRHGSIAERSMRELNTPVLLIRARATAEVRPAPELAAAAVI